MPNAGGVAEPACHGISPPHAARHGSERFEAAMRALGGVLWTSDADGCLRGAQPGWAALTGQPFEAYQGHGWAAALHPADAVAALDAWLRAVAERRPFESEHRILCADGAVRTFACRAVPVQEPGGSVREWVGVRTDVTERRAAEAKLSASNADLERRVEERTAELAKSAAGFRLLAEHAGDMIVRLSLDGVRLYVSPACEPLLGFRPDELRGRPRLSLIHPDDHAASEHAIAELAGGAQQARVTERLRHKDGRWVWVETSFRLVRDGRTGRPLEIHAALRDISARKTGEDALRAQTASFHALFERTADRLFVHRVLPDGTFPLEEVNTAGATGLGLSASALLGTCPSDYLDPGLAAQVQRNLERCREEGDTSSYEACVAHPSAATYFDVIQVPILDAGGAVERILVSARDSTDRKHAVAVLAEANRLLALSEQVAGLGHWRYEPASGRLHWSAEIYRIYGCDPDGPKPTVEQAVEAYHPEDRPTVYRALARSIAEGVGFDIAVRLIRTDGTLCHVKSRAVVETGPGGEVVALFGVFLDITDQVEAAARARDREERERQSIKASNAELEQLARHLARARDAAERSSQAKSRFLAGMSHELRTPLNGILGYAQLLRMDGGLSATQSARVEAMVGAGEHLLDMVNHVLDLSEIESGHVAVRTGPADLRHLLDVCLALVRPIAEAKGLAVGLAVASGTPPTLDTDSTRLRQILVNLLGNAVKFTGRGSVELRAGATGGGAALRFEVADTGPGIPAEHRQRLFQDFERLEVDAASPVEGAGLGLALSARLAALLGGRMGHEENPAGGSLFWLELPIGSSPVEAGAPLAKCPPPAATPPPPGLRVMVVDDAAMNRDIAGAFLRAAGHAVAFAEGGAEAVALAGASDFDVVLMDVRMPSVNGMEATRRIRAMAGPRGRVPVVALTAQAFAEQVRECHAAGMDDHLAKPFTPDALLEVVARAARAGSLRAGATTTPDPPAPAAALGAELLVFDAAGFARTAAFLAPEAVTSHLRTIAGRCEALLSGLRAMGAAARAETELAEAAHTLAGSAGMFGFDRLAAVARRFEQAVRTDSPDAHAHADGLAAAILASLHEMPLRADGT